MRNLKYEMRISLKMTGCKNNRYELDKIQEWSVSHGIGISDDGEADFSIINTCTVTQIADKKSRQMIRKTKNRNPKLQTIVFGCAARVQKKEFEKIKEIDFLLPDLKSVIGFLEDMNKKSANPTVGDNDHCRLPIGGLSDFNHTRAFVQIQDGCDSFCSYCIIAAARGKSKSRPDDEIISEINAHAKNGFKEIVLTGINIGAYGCTNTRKPEESRFAELLEKIIRDTDIPRIRISSLGPEYFFNYPTSDAQSTESATTTSRLQKTVAQKSKYILNKKLTDIFNNPRVCPHIHLSVQSGSDSVLKRMRRNYSVEQMDKIISTLKKEIPGIAITNDVIVGFPEETDEEFQETYDFIKRNGFAKSHIFPYSIRKNTLAEKMKQVPEKTKKERALRLQKLSDKQRAEFIKSQIGGKFEILWELDGEGLTGNYIKVKNLKKHPPRTITGERLTEENVVMD